MKKPLMLILNAVLLSMTYFASAQYSVIEYEKVQVSRSLSGHVNAGLPESPAENVTVELCSSDWNKVVASTKTDKDGYFAFVNPSTKLFYVRFSSPGIDPLQLRVQIKKSAKKDLTVHLVNAT